MKVLYFLPEGDNAPAKLARELYTALKKKNDLSLDLVPYPGRDSSLNNFYNPPFTISSRESKRLFFNQKAFTCVHITTSPFFAPTKRFLLHLYAILKKLPVVLNYHGDIRTETVNQFRNRAWVNFLSYLPSYFCVPFFLRHSGLIIVNSYVMRDLLEDKYGIRSGVRVIPNALDDFWFLDKGPEVSLKGRPSIFYHGRLSYEKGVDLLIRGLAESGSTDAVLYLAGSGEQLGSLRAIVKEKGLENRVIFLGKITTDLLKAYLSRADLAIYPSRYEPFSLAVLEAFAAMNGPVFFSNRAGISDFVQLMNFKLKPFSPTIDEIAKIIRDYSSSGNRRDLAFGGLVSRQKKFARVFEWDSVSEKYLQVYAEFQNNYSHNI